MVAATAKQELQDRADRSDGRALLAMLRGIVGGAHVITASDKLERYAKGYRCGGGPCVAAVRPGSLVEMWRVLEACVAAGAAIIMQAANTGLTGGSTPSEGCDRPSVIINTLRIKGVRPIRGGAQVICFAGSTLYELERVLKPLGREPHSVIGSSCIGASVVGGVCNNSGGALVRRGPAYTELSLFARVGSSGALELVNHLGITLTGDPENILAALDQPSTPLEGLLTPTQQRASDGEYTEHVRDVDAATPARFNADPRRLHEASGSAGKVAVFAVRLDTFPAELETATFYIGTYDPADLTWLRRELLSPTRPLPIAAEYMHREAFDIATRYGKDAFLAIRALGAGRLPLLYRIKSAIDAVGKRIPFAPNNLSDQLLQALAKLASQHLPARMLRFRDQFAHHLLLKVGKDSEAETAALLARLPSQSGAWFSCTPDESERAFLHRFVTAGAAVRYRAMHADTVEELVALDFALKRNEQNWSDTLPQRLEAETVARLYYGHFLCYVFHHDYLVRRGTDPHAFEQAVCAVLDARGAEYPAEHNVGHLYAAKPPLAQHYRALDPLNVFNPGVGKLSKRREWA